MNDWCLSLPTGGSAVADGQAVSRGTHLGGSEITSVASPAGGSC